MTQKKRREFIKNFRNRTNISEKKMRVILIIDDDG